MSLNFFTPDSNIGIKIQEILMTSEDGLTADQIKRELRKRGTHISDISSIKNILDDLRYFIRLSGDVYCLKSREYEEEESENREVKTDGGEIPSIVNLNYCLDSYIIFDTETTGLDPQEDRIIQIASLKVIDREPVEFINLYSNPHPKVISPELKKKLNLDKRPEIVEKIYSSRSIESVYESFSAFCDGLPLIAHNLQFDYSFLKSIDPQINHILLDTMELAILAVPGLEAYRLENLAKYLNISPVNPEEKHGIERLADKFSIKDFNWNSFHDARIDVLYLYRIYIHLLDKFLSGEANKIRLSLFDSVNISFGNNKLKELIKFTDYQSPSKDNRTRMDFSEKTCLSLLEEYLRKKDYRQRDGQVEMVKLVFRSFKENSFKMIEAPTGTGKTIAYIVPSVVFSLSEGNRVAISTGMKNLQEQLLGDIKDFVGTLGLEVYYQVLKGRDSYMCLRKFMSYLSELVPVATLPQELICAAYLISWISFTRDGTWDELNFWVEKRFPLLKELRKGFSSDSHDCPGTDCIYSNECFRKKAYKKAEHADIIVINHPLWFSAPADLPGFTRLILDEAHNLEDCATSAFTEEVSKDTWEDFFRDIINSRTRRGFALRLMASARDEELKKSLKSLFSSCRTLRSLVRDLGNHFKEFVKSCNHQLNEKYGAKLRLEREPGKIEAIKWSKVDGVRRQFNLHLNNLQGILRQLKEAISSCDDLQYKEEFLRNISSLIDVFLENYTLFNEILRVNNMNKVYWLEVEERNGQSPWWALKSAPVEVSGMLAEKYTSLSSAVFTSATLSIKGGDFSFFSSRLGLNPRLGENNTHIVDGSIDYSRAYLALVNYFNYIPSGPTMERFKEELSEELKLFLEFTEGKALVLFNSRERMEYACNLCSDYLWGKGIPVYCQLPGVSRKALKKEFAEDRNSVLMGLKSFWEGIDVPGESLSFVIMEKLPFPFIFDPLYRARRERFAVNPSCGHEFEDYIFPLMAINFKQGFGRLLRKEDDRGAVLLLDRRIHKKSYKYDLLSSLPGFTRDEEAENGRKLLYNKIADFLPSLIDLNIKQDFLNNLPEEILISIQKKLEEFSLPKVLSPEEYEENRPKLLLALKNLFGHEDFRSKEQEEIIKAILTGRDVLAILKTGAGKSLCFQLPALLRKGTTIVFSPLIALMKDQFESMKDKGIDIVDCIYSGQTGEDREEIYKRMKEGKSRLVYISPERVRDQQLLECIRHTDVTNIIIDEAHCIDMWGSTFRPDYLHISRIFDKLPARPTVAAFTATATSSVKKSILQKLEMKDPVLVQGSFDRPELNLIVYNSKSSSNPVKHKHDKFDVLLKILKTADLNRDNVLVYVSTTGEADQLARKLRVIGFDVRSYHGKMNSEQRDSVQEMFMDGHINMVVCTKAFGMGIDKRDIRYVIHYNIPGDIESYFQEIGRAGRDGEDSYCILLYHSSDLGVQKFFNQSVLPEESFINDILSYLRGMKQERFYLDIRNMVSNFDTEETELKIVLHILESHGFIKRDMDFTINASLLLMKVPSEIERFVGERYPEDYELVRDCFREIQPFHYRKMSINLLEVSNVLGKDVFIIEGVFIKLAMDGLIEFRPWEKGVTVVLTGLGQGKDGFIYNSDGESVTYYDTLEQKLDMMTAYASGKDVCRRKFILNYFGEEYPYSNCGKCDVCLSGGEVPWADMTDRDIPELCEFFDPPFTILEILKWNHELENKPFRSPYGKGTLTYILTGNDYMLLKNDLEQKRRVYRRKLFRQCPYFGILDRGPKEGGILGFFMRLHHEGYVDYREREYGQNGEMRKYSYPVPSVKGYERLEKGELFGW